MKEIITFTDSALKQLNLIIKSAPEGVDSILVGVEKGGCSGYSYKLDFAKSNEIKDFDFIQKKELKIFIDPKASMFLLGSEMDYKIDKLSSRFIFNNPNEKNTCGCGESFSV